MILTFEAETASELKAKVVDFVTVGLGVSLATTAVEPGTSVAAETPNKKKSKKLESVKTEEALKVEPQADARPSSETTVDSASGVPVLNPVTKKEATEALRLVISTSPGKAREILAQLGATRLSDVKPEQYEKLVELCAKEAVAS